jgi:hypothetical protein
MLFIAHRVNTVSELEKIPIHFGVELDLRDRGDDLILAHDPFSMGECFKNYLKVYNNAFIILNVKSERIEYRVLEFMKHYSLEKYFFLDCSFPMIYKLSSEGEHRLALRFSEFESIDTILAMQGKASWVWVDCFTKLPINQTNYQLLKSAGFKLCLVSPELQGRNQDIEDYGQYLLEHNLQFDAICTKSYNIERWQCVLSLT